jgi:hypothetical protein
MCWSCIFPMPLCNSCSGLVAPCNYDSSYQCYSHVKLPIKLYINIPSAFICQPCVSYSCIHNKLCFSFIFPFNLHASIASKTHALLHIFLTSTAIYTSLNNHNPSAFLPFYGCVTIPPCIAKLTLPLSTNEEKHQQGWWG